MSNYTRNSGTYRRRVSAVPPGPAVPPGFEHRAQGRASEPTVQGPTVAQLTAYISRYQDLVRDLRARIQSLERRNLDQEVRIDGLHDLLQHFREENHELRSELRRNW